MTVLAIYLNISTHTKFVHYCHDSLTIDYLGKFFYPPLTFQIFNKEKFMFTIFLQYFYNKIISGKLLLAVIGDKKKKSNFSRSLN